MLALYFCLLLSSVGFVCHGSQPSKKQKIEFSQKTVSEQLQDYFNFRETHKEPVIIERLCGHNYSHVENRLQVDETTYDLKAIILHSDELLNAKNVDGFIAYIAPIMKIKDELNKARNEKWEAVRWEHCKDIQKA